jgi:hypothetical protein
MTWYRDAANIIAKQRLEMSHLPESEQKKYCSQHYPFGERKYFPYKAWLRAMKHSFNKPEPKAPRKINIKESSENQITLF